MGFSRSGWKSTRERPRAAFAEKVPPCLMEAWLRDGDRVVLGKGLAPGMDFVTSQSCRRCRQPFPLWAFSTDSTAALVSLQNQKKQELECQKDKQRVQSEKNMQGERVPAAPSTGSSCGPAADRGVRNRTFVYHHRPPRLQKELESTGERRPQGRAKVLAAGACGHGFR